MISNNHFKSSIWIEKNIQKIPKNSLLLDLACGNGRHSIVAQKHNLIVTAVDINENKLSRLQNINNIMLVKCNLEKEKFNWSFKKNIFDAILVTNYLYRPIFQKIIYSIKPRGYLIYETFTEENINFGRPNNPEYLLYQGELLNFAKKNGMHIIEYEEIIQGNKKSKALQRIFAKFK